LLSAAVTILAGFADAQACLTSTVPACQAQAVAVPADQERRIAGFGPRRFIVRERFLVPAEPGEHDRSLPSGPAGQDDLRAPDLAAWAVIAISQTTSAMRATL
jgi:hypothetical protein